MNMENSPDNLPFTYRFRGPEAFFYALFKILADEFNEVMMWIVGGPLHGESNIGKVYGLKSGSYRVYYLMEL